MAMTDRPEDELAPAGVEPAEIDPDYRFTLANERTYLAWIRTTLGLLAGSIAVVHLVPDVGLDAARQVVGSALAVVGALLAGSAMRRWSVVQRAMRRGEDLPPTRMPMLLGFALIAGSIAVFVIVAFGD